MKRRFSSGPGTSSFFKDVAVIANETDSIPKALHSVLKRVCEFAEWDLGQVFLQDEEEPGRYVDGGIRVYNEMLLPGPASLIEENLRPVDATSALPAGRVIASGTACFGESDVAGDEQTRTAGGSRWWLYPVFAFPVVSGDDVVAVAQFFSREREQESDASVLSVMEHVGDATRSCD